MLFPSICPGLSVTNKIFYLTVRQISGYHDEYDESHNMTDVLLSGPRALPTRHSAVRNTQITPSSESKGSLRSQVSSSPPPLSLSVVSDSQTEEKVTTCCSTTSFSQADWAGLGQSGGITQTTGCYQPVPATTGKQPPPDNSPAHSTMHQRLS